MSSEPTPTEESEARVEQLREALETRSDISRAQGMLMERYGIDQGSAFDLLRRLSNNTNIKLQEIAGAVIAGASIEDIQPPEPRVER